MSVIASARGLAFRFPDATTDALAGVDWQAEAGSVTLVVGPSGSGKSTFLRCLNGLVPHFHGGSWGGSVEIAGRDTRRTGPRELARYVGSVFQDPEAQFVTDRVDDEIVFGLENLGAETHAMRVRLEETLDLLGIAYLRERDVASLSGGERQRVAIAAALATTPNLLVLDEPTSQLDPIASIDVLGAIQRLNADLGITVVIAEHRLDRVLPFADELVALKPGRFAAGPTREMLDALDDVPPMIAWARRQGLRPLPLTVREARRAISGLPLRTLPEPAARTAGDELVRLERVEFRYDQRPALRGISFDGRQGEVIALVGRNGSGKTTLLRQISGLLRPRNGRVLVGCPGADIANVPVHQIAQTVGYVPQHPSSILHAETVLDELRFTARAQRRQVDCDGTLASLGIAHLANRHPLDLSGGERQRVALAALAVTEPAVLLLDEPTRGLPMADKEHLAAFVRGYATAGRLVIVATHDVDFVAVAADRVLLLADGALVADGTPHSVLAGSLAFAPQVNRVLGGGVLTLADALAATIPPPNW